MMNGQPAATSAIRVVVPGSVSWITVSFWTPGPRALDLERDARRRLVAASPGLLVGHDEAARGVATRTSPVIPAWPRRAQLPWAAGGPVGMDRGAVPVAGREVRFGESPPDGLGRRTDEGGEDVARGGLGGRRGGGLGGRHRVDLQDGLEVCEEVGGADRVAVQPPVVDPSDGDGVEVVVALPPDLAARDEVRPFEDAEVLHDAEPRHLRQHRLQLSQRLAVTLEEPVEQRPAGWGRPAPGTPRRPRGHNR